MTIGLLYFGINTLFWALFQSRVITSVVNTSVRVTSSKRFLKVRILTVGGSVIATAANLKFGFSRFTVDTNQ